MKYLKWAILLSLVFLSATLAGPFFVLSCWIDRTKSNEWLNYIGESLVKKIIADFTS